MLSACGGGSSNTPSPNRADPTIDFDCVAGPQCPEITIAGDPPARLPNDELSPTRGYADPSIRKDPNSGRLWMSYSYVGLHADPAPTAGDPPLITPYVSIHLAHSDDGGDTWQYQKDIWESSLGSDNGFSSRTGYSVHEVSTLTPFSIQNTTSWLALHLQYFLPQGQPIAQRTPSSFHYPLARGEDPANLDTNATALLTNPLTAPGWGSHVNLSQLDPALQNCDLWSEASLFQDGATLYLAAECLVFDMSTDPWTRNYAAEFIGVFASDGLGDVRDLQWRWLGKLTTHADVQALGGLTLTQIELTRARDGSLLAMVVPVASEGMFLGCRVLTVESLDPPRLRRDDSAAPRLRADLRAADADSAGLCSYDPASNTGVILVRVTFGSEPGDVQWSLHATGVHP